jgi:ABC-type multidrug transport system fused ATPase/permease subunit
MSGANDHKDSGVSGSAPAGEGEKRKTLLDAVSQRDFLLIAAAAAALLLLAWTRALDELTLDYLDGALLGSGAIYATARSINALVSVLQGTEIDVVFVSFSVGEMLDPVNDLIERFSGLLLLALGSLALQQLLIGIVSHPGVNLVLSLLVVAAVLLWPSCQAERRRRLLYLLLLLALLRLIVPLIALTTHWMETAFLAEAEQEHYRNVRQFQAQLEQVGKEAGISSESREEAARLEEVRAEVNAARLDAEARISALEGELARARERLSQMPRPPLWKPWEPESTEVTEVRQEIEVLEGQLELRRSVAAQLGKEAAALNDQLDCLQRRREGRECSFAEGAVQFVRNVDIRPQLIAISERVEAFSADLISLLTSLMFKAVLLPIATLWLSVRLTLAVARRLGS